MKFILAILMLMTAAMTPGLATAATAKKKKPTAAKVTKKKSVKKTVEAKPQAVVEEQKEEVASCQPGQSDSDAERIQGLLREQREILTILEGDARRVKLARLRLVQKAISAVEMQMQSDALAGRNSITIQTVNLVQHLIVKYRFSKTFFGWEPVPSDNSIYTEMTAPLLTQLHGSAKAVTTLFGLDDSPYTTIIATSLRELHKTLGDLDQISLDPRLRDSLRGLAPRVGDALSEANQGDRSCAFYSAYFVVKSMRMLYPDFDQVATSSAGFSMVMDIQGLTEFLAEYIQFDLQVKEPARCGVR